MASAPWSFDVHVMPIAKGSTFTISRFLSYEEVRGFSHWNLLWGSGRLTNMRLRRSDRTGLFPEWFGGSQRSHSDCRKILYQYPNIETTRTRKPTSMLFYKPRKRTACFAMPDRWKAEHSKIIVEFGMTLEGPAARCHAKHLPGSITTFDGLKTKFLHFFRGQVD